MFKTLLFSGEVVDQLHPSDRILQHILLKQLKPTFKHVINPNCYHLDGSTGVKYATQRIFSGIYLKPLDDALSKMDVYYLRFQYNILIFAKKRQLSGCRRPMMDVLHERRLSLSRKKLRMGCIKGGLHFLGIDYLLPTRTKDNTNMTHINDAAITPANNVHYLNENGKGKGKF